MIAVVVEGASFSSSKRNSIARVVKQTVPCAAIFQFTPHIFREKVLFNKLFSLIALYKNENIFLAGKSLGAVRVCDFIQKHTHKEEYTGFYADKNEWIGMTYADNISVLLVDPYQPFKYKYGESYTLKRKTVRSVISTYQMCKRPKGAVVIGALNVQQVCVDHNTIVHSEKTREMIKKASEVFG